jgi:hypothetical protein
VTAGTVPAFPFETTGDDMFQKLAMMAMATVALVAMSPAPGAQMCPDSCPVNFRVSANGGFATGDLVTLTPLNTNSATSALLGVVGGGFFCSTCTPCSVDILVSWTIVTSACVSYNTCGLLQNGPGSGSAGTTLTRNCNQPGLNLKLEYGTCNLGHPTCPPPVVSPAAYTAVWTLTCGDCQ